MCSDFVTDLDELHQQLRQHISTGSDDYQLLEFKIGSQVYVKAQFVRNERNEKSREREFTRESQIALGLGEHLKGQGVAIQEAVNSGVPKCPMATEVRIS